MGGGIEVDAVSNTTGKTGISMSDGTDGTSLSGTVTVKGDVTVTNNPSSGGSYYPVTGVDISTTKGLADLDIKGEVTVDVTKSEGTSYAFGIGMEGRSEIYVGGDVTAKANNHAKGLNPSVGGTSVNVGGITAEAKESYGIYANLGDSSIQGNNNFININIADDITASGSTCSYGAAVLYNAGNININVDGDIAATGSEFSVGVLLANNKGNIDVNVGGDIESSGDAINISDIAKGTLTEITVGGTISAESGDAIYVYKAPDTEAADPVITAWKIESNKGSLVKVNTWDGSSYAEDNDAEEKIKSNINYIIKADATENGETSSNGKIVLTSDSTMGEVTIGDKTYKTANQDQKIIINVEVASGYKQSLYNGEALLKANSDGSYTITVPEGGGVDLRAVLEKIEEQRRSSGNSDRYSSGSSSSSSSGIVPTVIYAAGISAPSGDSSWSYDNAGWKLKKSDGNFASSEWREVSWNGINSWYHFNTQGYADGGWYTDTDGQRYYFYNNHDGAFGRMLTGWNEIDGQWYYFNTIAVNGGSLGSLVTDGTTPDGYKVDASGAWVQ